MKRRIIIVSILLVTVFEATSQTSKDTTCLPNEQLKKAVDRIELCKVMEKEIALSKELISNQIKLLSNKDSIIATQKTENTQYKDVILNYKKTEEGLLGIIDSQKKQIKTREKIYRRQKKTKYITAIIGFALGFLITK